MNVPAGEYEGGRPVGLGGHKPLHLLPGPVVEENLKVGFLEKLLAIVKYQVAYRCILHIVKSVQQKCCHVHQNQQMENQLS